MSSPAHGAYTTDFDAIVVGAGFGGLHALHLLRQQGLSVKVFEQGGGVGGTWYWNRYPGARCDSESVYYMFSDHFSQQVLQEWTWSERFAGHAEIRDYLDFVADKLDLRGNIQFNTKVTGALYNEETNRWEITTDDGTRVTARYLITAVGCISATNLPPWPGLDEFSGDWYHTGAWPHEPVDLAGKRVAVIGTGATGVQAIPEIAKQAEHLYVFQRTPNYNIPARNKPIDSDYVGTVKNEYGELWQRARESGFGLPYQVREGSALDDSPEKRETVYESAWAKGGFYIGLETYSDFLVNRPSNDTIAEFVRKKIREIVRDPATAALLSPTDHPFFTKRPPLETDYYNTFNRNNVTLLDVRTHPIESITKNGVRTSEGEFDVDVIVFATGFDTMTGTLFKMGIKGRSGEALETKWVDGPRTYLGLTTHGFPNLFMITGPQSPSVLSNMPVAIEQNAEFIAGLIAYMREHDVDCVEPTEEAERKWVSHHSELADATLLLGTNSWWVGANIPGKPRTLYPYVGGVGGHAQICQEVREKGYEGFTLVDRSPAIP
jgi:cation diffusion facilitator CzcD-associated flavoprotein CzcO